MIRSMKSAFRGIAVAMLLLAVEPVRAEYLLIQLKVYGLDCEVCARGVSASVGRLAGVETVVVSLKKGTVELLLARGNKFKMSDLRNRIRENGFRPMEATVTAVGRSNGSKFEVLGSGESYDIGSRAAKTDAIVEISFEVH